MQTGHQEPDTLLIVDDQAANISVLFDFLVNSGFRVLVAQDGESALEKAEFAAPHMILLDVMMPGINGFEVCRRLKQDAKTRDIPVIFMTALSDTQYTLKGFELGAVDYITKPIQQEEVLARITTQLTIRRIYLELQDKTRELVEKNRLLQQEIVERQRAEAALNKANETLRRLATSDGLTGVANRRLFDDYFDQEWHRMAHEQKPLSLILCDIDYFKPYNDTYGHQGGDDCLRKVAQAIATVAKRSTDLVARYGGEEFAVLISNTATDGALEIAREIQTQVEALGICHGASLVKDRVTLSLGVSSIVPDKELAPAALLRAADLALYSAKKGGRNEVVFRDVEVD